MNKTEAIEECKRYLAHMEEQRVRAKRMQELARMARNGQPEEAKRALRKLDAERMNSTVVYDGSKLEQAIIELLKSHRTLKWAYEFQKKRIDMGRDGGLDALNLLDHLNGEMI